MQLMCQHPSTQYRAMNRKNQIFVSLLSEIPRDWQRIKRYMNLPSFRLQVTYRDTATRTSSNGNGTKHTATDSPITVENGNQKGNRHIRPCGRCCLQRVWHFRQRGRCQLQCKHHFRQCGRCRSQCKHLFQQCGRCRYNMRRAYPAVSKMLFTM